MRGPADAKRPGASAGSSLKQYTFYILYKRSAPEGARANHKGSCPAREERGPTQKADALQGPADQGMITSFRPFRPFPVRPYPALQGQVP